MKELRQRKPTRLKGYDYSTPTKYFLTVCVKNKQKLLGDIVGRGKIIAPYNNQTSKFISLLKHYCNRDYGKNIWQRSFNDHIIRGEQDYLKIW